MLVPDRLDPDLAVLGDVDPRLPVVRSGDVTYRVPGYGFITGSRIYPNDTGICGWVAAAILTRYWHARFPRKGLLPRENRAADSNMTERPNFATYLQGSSGSGTWARTVTSRLSWSANRQRVRSSG